MLLCNLYCFKIMFNDSLNEFMFMLHYRNLKETLLKKFYCDLIKVMSRIQWSAPSMNIDQKVTLLFSR